MFVPGKFVNSDLYKIVEIAHNWPSWKTIYICQQQTAYITFTKEIMNMLVPCSAQYAHLTRCSQKNLRISLIGNDILMTVAFEERSQDNQNFWKRLITCATVWLKHHLSLQRNRENHRKVTFSWKKFRFRTNNQQAISYSSGVMEVLPAGFSTKSSFWWTTPYRYQVGDNTCAGHSRQHI